MHLNVTIAAHKIEHLVVLEAQRGPILEKSPAINDVLEYLNEVCFPKKIQSVNSDIFCRYLALMKPVIST